MTAQINKAQFNFKLPEMQSYHSTWDDADYEPVFPTRHPGLAARAVRLTRKWLAHLAERHRVMNELSTLSDRDLADLGLTRYDIPRVFDPDFAAEHAARRQN